MSDTAREERYEIEGRVFVKRYEGGGVRFFRDGEELDITAWNRALNEVQPMRLLDEHPNPLVRLKERHRRAAFVRFIGDVDGKTVADIGCEEGHLAAMLLPRCEKLYCIDIDAGMLDAAARVAGGGDGVEFIQSDVRDIRLPDDSLDVCVAAEVLEHLPAPEEGVSELVRVTKPGGRIVISVPNEKLLQNIKRLIAAAGMRRSLGRLSSGLAVGHVQVFTAGRIRGLCAGKIELDAVKYSAPFFLNIFASGSPVK